MARFANSVMFTPAAGGTVDFVVSAAVQGFMTPALAGAPTGLYKYRAESSDLSQWEIGEGTYTSGTTTLTRTTVLYNSAGTGSAPGQSGAGSKINFTVAPNVGMGLQSVADTLEIENTGSFTATQQDQGRLNLGIKQMQALAGSTDLNTITDPGTYYATGAVTNGPVANDLYLFVQLMGLSSTGVSQTVWQRSTGIVYTRVFHSSAWTSWKKIGGDYGHIPSEPAGGNAAVGEIGEYVEYNFGATALTSGAAAVNIGSGSFTSGDWDVRAWFFVTGAGATTLSNATFSVSATSATTDNSGLDRYWQMRFATSGNWQDPIINATVGPHRRSLGATTTLYCTALASFGSTLSVSAKIAGRRVR